MVASNKAFLLGKVYGIFNCYPVMYFSLNGAAADVWFEPVQVWEVKAADLSISPVYAAASGIVSTFFSTTRKITPVPLGKSAVILSS